MQEIYQKLKIIGLLLHLANADFIQRDMFYDLKADLLHRFGTYNGLDIQYIEQKCWSCDGTGIYPYTRYGPDACWNCSKGVYNRFNVRLLRYRLGGYEFHKPLDRLPAKKDEANIIGYIRHKPFPFYLGREAELWLYLIFDRKVFKRTFATFSFPLFEGVRPRVITPLLFASILVFRIKHTLPRKIRRLKNRIDEFVIGGRKAKETIVIDDIPF